MRVHVAVVRRQEAEMRGCTRQERVCRELDGLAHARVLYLSSFK